jgi:hypothetical protein
LDQTEAATPCALLVEEIEPFYPKGERGRPPIGLERTLRMYVVQQCFGLADEATEDAVYDSQSIRAFIGIDSAGRGFRGAKARNGPAEDALCSSLGYIPSVVLSQRMEPPFS